MAGGARKGQPHAPAGQGNVSCWTANGVLVCRGVVTRDGVTHRARAVSATRGLSEAGARRKAHEHLRALVRSLDAGETPDPARDRTTLADWVAVWSEETRAALDAPSSWPRYRDLLEHHVLPTLGRLRLTAIRPPQVLAWRDWMRTDHGPLRRPSSAVEIRRAEALLRQVLKAAGAREHAVSEAVFKMAHVKAKSTKRPGLDAAQFLALVGASGEPWRTMYVVAYYAMTRDGETRGLTWERVLWASNQVDVAQQIDRAGTVRAPKHGSSGLVDVPAEAVAVLAAHRVRVEAELGRPVRPDEFVFTRRGRPIDQKAALTALKADLRRAGLPDSIAWHSFRRGGATAHAAAAVDPLTLRQLMRHTDLDTTTAYLRPVVRGGREAAERMAERVRRGE
jgi:integrase